METEARLVPQIEALRTEQKKVEDGFRFQLVDISRNLKEYPNLGRPEFAKRVNEWEENCTKHILQTLSAVTKSLASQFDRILNENPELATVFKEGEDFHMEAQSREIRENPNTKIRTLPVTW